MTTLKTKKFFKKIPEIIGFKDILMAGGLIMAGKGLYLIYPPAMWLIIGGFIIFLGWPWPRRTVK